MSAIENFIKQYEKEYDFYKQLTIIANEILEFEIQKRGVKAIVSSRAKRVDRLREKLLQRNSNKEYKTKISIEKDIVDLAGLRVALYFPSERDMLGKLIEEIFIIEEIKTFPENEHKPKFNKRFSGYWASHYRVKLKKTDDVDIRFTKTIFEIQVASVLMHAWSEVEHDLVYKPFTGNLTEDELAILDEINGLVLTGEIALERLQKAITERTKKQKEITDKYDLTNLISENYKNNFKNINFGNTGFLNQYLYANSKIDMSQLSKALKNITSNLNESFSDQLLQNIISINTANDSLKKYFEQFPFSKKTISAFELFTKTWIIFEKSVAELNSQSLEKDKKAQSNPILDIERASKEANLTIEEQNNIYSLRKIRNQVLHGRESFTDSQLSIHYTELKEIVEKCINAIKDENTSKTLLNELQYK
ncbi:RelA/SpoT domain-containing protein [Elizabethkingia anophelis]|uniref:GTP pyrophosphokinase n=1 Tax=Elizabethkingia anophelis TaxID=1117645 RepID=UPI0020B42CD6|nr:RelA/SpoT domain-containing protein [Elizabethkingia anophelis]MCT3991302.1 RelA/SpoT domain-containing protein [Elizabethkingia anophelis]MCT4009268.1 RelA/SpoT domain-containing protein [Elizabethkingia anophelis]MDV4141869.1 RelA/SpoT protein [Elizabethkingia anophelis]UTF95468.1 RelA/SpoT domain-containing protein [Elizabethkingia anophelis]